MAVTLEVTVSEFVYDQAVASLELRGDLNRLVENLLIQHLDEAIPLPLNEATLAELYVQRYRYVHRLRVLEETIRQFDSLCVTQFEVNQEIRHATSFEVSKQLRVQQAIAKINQAIESHPQHNVGSPFPHRLEALADDLEAIENIEDCADLEMQPEPSL